MPTILSRLAKRVEIWSFKYNCYEAVHPWTPFCSDGALDIGSTVFVEAVKLYTPLYLFSQFMRRRYDANSFRETGLSIFRSTSFISTNAYFAILFFCSSQKVTGKFYYYFAAYLPAFVASAMAILIERPMRRSSLAFYVANVATETLFRIAVARGLVRAINNGQVYIFTISVAVIMMLAKKNGFEDDPLSTAIRMIVGAEEACPRQRKKKPIVVHMDNDLHRSLGSDKLININKSVADGDNELYDEQEQQQRDNSETNLGGKQQQLDSHHCSTGNRSPSCSKKVYNNHHSSNNPIMRFKDTLVTILYAQHKLCPHKHIGSCFYYVFRSGLRGFLIGYLGQLSLKLLTRSHVIVRNPSLILSMASQRSVINLGLFLSLFTSLYKLTNCTLRWTTDSSSAMNCFISSMVAGPAMLIYPSSTISLYVMWKCLEALFHEAVRRGIIKRQNLFIIFLYAISTSQLFYSAILDPRYMKSSYMTFLDRMSDHRLHMLNRSVLDVFGTDASSGYEDYFPNLHPKFMSSAFQESIWIWLLENKFAPSYIR